MIIEADYKYNYYETFDVKMKLFKLIIMVVFLTATCSMMFNIKGITTYAQPNQKNATTTNITTGASSENKSNMTSLGYITKIRSLLNQTLTAYKSGNYVKAKELATTAYIDNFENIEKPIGPALKQQGEDLLREKLRHQIYLKDPIEQIKSNIDQINKLLDKSALSLTH